MCTSNVSKDLSHLIASEYDSTKEKQDNMLKFDEYWTQPNALDEKQRALEAAQIRTELGEHIANSEAVSAAGVSTLANSALGDDALSSRDPKAKGMRKKNADPEAIKLREQKQKENKLQRESDNYQNAQSTFSEFIGNTKPREQGDALQQVEAASKSSRRFVNKEVSASVVGPTEEL